jgi:hypothetical protein
LRERLKLALPVLVRGRESAADEWSEMTHLVDVTPSGARVRLKRQIRWGQLLRLMMALPRQMRCYDFLEQQYLIWGVVRHVTTLVAEGEASAALTFDVGLAFVGKHPPASYEQDPATVYDVENVPGKDGLWQLRIFEGGSIEGVE